MNWKNWYVPPAWFALPANRRPRHYAFYWMSVIVVLVVLGIGVRGLFFAPFGSVGNNVAGALTEATEVPTDIPTAAPQVAAVTQEPTSEPPTATATATATPIATPTMIPVEIAGTALVTNPVGLVEERNWVSGFTTDIQALNVRRGAGTNYRSFDTLTGGTVIKLLARNGEASWALLLLEDGTTGWVSARYIVLAQGTVIDLPISNEPATAGEEQPLPAGFGG